MAAAPMGDPTTQPVATPTLTASATLSPRPGGSNLSATLLTIEDMPTGWSVDTDDNPGSSTPCGERLPCFSEGATEYHRVAFQRSPSLGPFITHVIARYPSGSAERLLNERRQLLERCPSWQQMSGTTTQQIRAAALSSPRLGDQTFAYRLTLEDGGIVGQSDQVVIRHGDTLILIGGIAAGLGAVAGVDAELLERLARLAEQRLQDTQ